MTGRRDVSKKRRFFSLTASLVLILSTLLVGISINIPDASGGGTDMDKGNVHVDMLTDFGRILYPLDWFGAQTVQDISTLAYIGLVVDHDNYDHTAGAEDIADCWNTTGPFTADDFRDVNPITMIFEDATTQKSFGSFQNKGGGTGYPDDILISQTAWSVLNKDWVILQWTINNVKSPASTLTNVRIGLEVAISKEGGRFGLGGELNDGGDDVDGYDSTNDIYWARDTAGIGADTTIGFGSTIATDPITHYYAEDYYVDYSSEYVNFFTNDSWLYQRISGASQTATDGVTPGNITATVGWDGFDILAGESRTVNLVIAINGTYNDMVSAIKDAQYYYQNVATGFQITEIRDSGSATPRIEVFNNGREPTDIGSVCSLSANVGGLTGGWNPGTIQTYGYSVFTPLENINAEGDTVRLYEGAVLIDEVSYGQDGIAPDPLVGESVGRRFDTSTVSYSNDWLRDPTPTWGLENDVGNIISSFVVINRVLFNPFSGPGDEVEGYVELMFTDLAPGGIDISNYRIVCDDVYTVPPVTQLYPTDKFFVLRYSNMPAFFNDPNGMTPAGDNVYLYDSNDNLLDMVGWSSTHNQGEFMSRIPDGFGTHQGYDDATSLAAGWVFDQRPSLMLTEFYTDTGAAQIEIYNPRGGDKVLDPRWTLDVGLGPLTGGWGPDPIIWKDYSTFNMGGGGPPGGEGDTIILYYQATDTKDQVSYGTSGVAPDPLSGESTARYWDTTIPGYTNDWNRDDIDTFGSQNDVPPINKTPDVVMNEVMFNPTLAPDGRFVVLMNVNPSSPGVNISNYYLVCDDFYQLPSYPTAPGGWDGILYFGWTLIIRFGDDAAADSFFNSMDPPGDNVYFYDNNGELLDMVGWNNPHNIGMSVRRIPDGNGTYQGYDDVTSVAAGWVFNTPLQVFVTEISDSGPSRIEVYNPWYPTIDFTDPSYTFENSLGGPITGTWSPPGTADSGGYAVFDVTGGLNTEGDTISFKHNGYLIDEVSYGLMGTVPDPLDGESVERYWDGTTSSYSNVWERNWTSGSNFGLQNDVPPANLTSALILNEIMFNPNLPADGFVEVLLRFGTLNISGYKLVGNTEYIIPDGTILTAADRFYYLMYSAPLADAFFNALDPSGDNVYLYDNNGSLIDMAGWSSPHDQGKTMCRVPDGAGTRNGYDDTSSIAAGWVFNCAPTIQMVKVSLRPPSRSKEYGNLGGIIYFNLTITNKQSVDDTVLILNSTVNGYPIVIFDETGTFIMTEIFVPAGSTENISVMVILPTAVPFIAYDNITITIQSQNVSVFMDVIPLQAVILPFIMPEKYVTTEEIYVKGTGHDEITTITLNLTGMGAILELRQPQDVIFCVDISGSMANDPAAISIIKEGLTYYVNEMTKPDKGALVVFGGPTGLVNPLTDNYADLLTDISNIPDPPNGPSTPMGDALNYSINELLLNGNASNIRVIILLTDGWNNDGTHDPLTEAFNAASHNITIFTIGLSSPDNFTLQTIADLTNGTYFYAPNAQEILDIYKLIAGYIGDIAGRDTITSDANPMIRDVLPPWIELVYGSFSIPPETNYTVGGGFRILEWNLSSLGIGESWEVTFQVKSTMLGSQWANDVSNSRVYYEDQFDNEHYVLFPETWLNVLPGTPLPPKLKIDMPNTNDILLNWDERLIPGTEKYLIYRASSPTGFDFSSPWVDTNSSLTGVDPIDGFVIPLRTTWNHTGAADPSDALEYSEQWYYCIRSVNTAGEISRTSRTLGKWTKEFIQAGVSTFSLPLEPIETMTPTADFFVNDMGANYIKWMDPGTHVWRIHGGIFVNDTTLEVGKGYEVDFTSPTKYTFLGMPGSMIRYNSIGGFDYNTDAKSLTASVDDISGNVTLNWGQPSGMNNDDFYKVYYSTTRDGFDGAEGTDYLPLPPPYDVIPVTGLEQAIHAGATLLFNQIYYMVVSENETGAEGTSTYSLGVWTANYLDEYDTIGIPLIQGTYETADWFCDQIDNAVGINFYKDSVVGWSWHSTRMPSGAFDPTLIMTDGYQISTSAPTRFTFIGYLG
jgi:Ca-activated chloride channel family protein